MAITSVSTLAELRTRVRLMAGIEQEELDNDTLDLLISIAGDWFYEQIGETYDVTSADATYDNAVMYYSCYLASIAQNGMGIERDCNFNDTNTEVVERHYSGFRDIGYNPELEIWAAVCSMVVVFKNNR